MSDHFDIMLERKLETKPKQADDTVVVRRMELITGTGRRRRWSIDDKARVLVESFRPGANVSEVARRHGISPQQLFAWRREVREPITESAGEGKSSRPKPYDTTNEDAPAFAPVVIAAVPKSQGGSQPPSPPPGTGTIEITIGDAIVRVVGHVDISLLTVVLRAVRRAS